MQKIHIVNIHTHEGMYFFRINYVSLTLVTFLNLGSWGIIML